MWFWALIGDLLGRVVKVLKLISSYALIKCTLQIKLTVGTPHATNRVKAQYLSQIWIDEVRPVERTQLRRVC